MPLNVEGRGARVERHLAIVRGRRVHRLLRPSDARLDDAADEEGVGREGGAEVALSLPLELEALEVGDEPLQVVPRDGVGIRLDEGLRGCVARGRGAEVRRAGGGAGSSPLGRGRPAGARRARRGLRQRRAEPRASAGAGPHQRRRPGGTAQAYAAPAGA